MLPSLTTLLPQPALFLLPLSSPLLPSLILSYLFSSSLPPPSLLQFGDDLSTLISAVPSKEPADVTEYFFRSMYSAVQIE